jgi:hydroxyacylglutathione hydrolase
VHLEIIRSKGLAHNSYYLSDAKEALVVDPRRDCDVYNRLAEKDCAKIEYILETHRNEDYVIGSIELQALTDSEIAHSKETPFKYGEHRLEDGDIIQLGELTIKVLYTPGHTNDSVCYVVYTSENLPYLVFTGDTLFAGDVGRTDLLGEKTKQKQSGKLFDSLQETLYPLGEHVVVYPAHGGGSVCGHHISNRQVTSIGYEWRSNPLLTMNREDFVKSLMNEQLLKPTYFAKMEQINLDGPPLIKKPFSVASLNIQMFEEKMRADETIILDTRETDAFAASHIPGAINIWLDGVTFFPGWVLNYDQKILLVTDRKEDLEIAKVYLLRLGFDNIVGYLCPGIKEWRTNGKSFDQIKTLSVIAFKQKLDQNEISVVDVRSPNEWKQGYIKGAERVYVGLLQRELLNLPYDRPVASICSVGDRAGMGASILKKTGFTEVYNVLGGMTAWKNMGYPMEK